MALLDSGLVKEKLTQLQEWKLEGGEIVRTLSFENFLDAMSFVNAVAEKAEAAGHHPDIDIRYNKVRLALVSHDAGGLTDRDFRMAETIDKLPTKN